MQAEDSPQAKVLRVHPGRPAALRRGQSCRHATHGHRGSEEAQQEQEAGQEARYGVHKITNCLICDQSLSRLPNVLVSSSSSQEVWCFPGLWVSDQADPSYPGSWAEQGRQVPLTAHPQWEPEHKGGWSQVHHQIPDEEGVFCCFLALWFHYLTLGLKKLISVE